MHEVDVATLQPQDFAASQLTPRRQKDGEPITIRNDLDCRCEFSDGRHRSLYGAGLSGPAHLARVVSCSRISES